MLVRNPYAETCGSEVVIDDALRDEFRRENQYFSFGFVGNRAIPLPELVLMEECPESGVRREVHGIDFLRNGVKLGNDWMTDDTIRDVFCQPILLTWDKNRDWIFSGH